MLHAGLASGHTPPGSQSVADAPHALARSSSTAARTLSRGAVAGSVLGRLAAVLSVSTTQILMDHMHHILVELFVHHGDASGDANAVVSGGIDFMFAQAEFGEVTFHDLIKMCSGELMQELVLRLGGAADNGAYMQTVRALNTLIPVAMANSNAEADESGGDGMLSGQPLGSSDVNGANMQLCAYIQQNYFMLMQFLREKVRHGTPSESHAAVGAIHKLLILIKESGHAEIQHSWWAELVVTFKTLLEQQAHREQALRAMRTFVLLLDVEQLARGLQQLVMMLLPHLQPHTQLVVAVLEAVVGREEAGEAAALRSPSGGRTRCASKEAATQPTHHTPRGCQPTRHR